MARGKKAVPELAGDDPLGIGAAETAGTAEGADVRDEPLAGTGEAVQLPGATDAAGEPLPPVAQPVPPAPGEDPASVFERRLDRLTAIVEEAEFDSGTAFGDLRDLIVDLFKHRPKVWSAMSASEQQDLVRHVESVTKAALRKVVLVIAQEDSDTIEGTFLGNFTVKGEAIEAKLKIEGVDEDVLMHAYRLAGHKVVIVSADDRRFSATRREVPIMPDQTKMVFADDARPAAPRDSSSMPPADDSDLAGGEGEAADAEDEDDSFGVFDEDTREWLIDESGGEDGWTDNPADAGRWTHARATELAADFPESSLAVRHLEPATAEG